MKNIQISRLYDGRRFAAKLLDTIQKIHLTISGSTTVGGWTNADIWR